MDDPADREHRGDPHPAAVGEVARLFLRLGVTAFGGPAAHIAMMREDVVRRRGWVDDATFLDLVGACHLVPGPNSTELALHLGLRRGGWRGMLAAAAGFILPASAIVLLIAWAYDRYGTSPTAVDLSYGILPVIVAVVADAVLGLTRSATRGLRDRRSAVIAVGAAVVWWSGAPELPLLVVAALVGTLLSLGAARVRDVASAPVGGLTLLATGATPDVWRLGWSFLKIGAVLYGSGYVLVSFLDRELVRSLGWLTERQLLDAVAVGQVTPGPVFTTATFVGYQIAGVAGAVVATVAIFTPSFLFVALLDRIVPAIRRSAAAGAALDAVVAASLGLMAAVLVRIAATALVDPLTIALAAAATIVLVRWRPNSAWLVAAGAAVGLACAVTA